MSFFLVKLTFSIGKPHVDILQRSLYLYFISPRLIAKYGEGVGEASSTPTARHYWFSGRGCGTFCPSRGGVSLEVGKGCCYRGVLLVCRNEQLFSDEREFVLSADLFKRLASNKLVLVLIY